MGESSGRGLGVGCSELGAEGDSDLEEALLLDLEGDSRWLILRPLLGVSPAASLLDRKMVFFMRSKAEGCILAQEEARGGRSRLVPWKNGVNESGYFRMMVNYSRRPWNVTPVARSLESTKLLWKEAC